MNYLTSILMAALFLVNSLSFAGETVLKSSNPFEQDRELSIQIVSDYYEDVGDNLVSINLCQMGKCDPIGPQKVYPLSDLKKKLVGEGAKIGGAVAVDLVIILITLVSCGATLHGFTAGWGAYTTTIVAVDAAVLTAEGAAINHFDFLNALNPFEHIRSFSTLKKAISEKKEIQIKSVEKFSNILEELLQEKFATDDD